MWLDRIPEAKAIEDLRKNIAFMVDAGPSSLKAFLLVSLDVAKSNVSRWHLTESPIQHSDVHLVFQLRPLADLTIATREPIFGCLPKSGMNVSHGFASPEAAVVRAASCLIDGCVRPFASLPKPAGGPLCELLKHVQRKAE
jgi:hypothetical protein